MYLIDHVAELQFVNRLIYAIKRIYTHTSFLIKSVPSIWDVCPTHSADVYEQSQLHLM